MAVLALERLHARIFPALIVVALAAACGNGASTPAPGAAGSDAAVVDANGADAGGCPSGASTSCVDCNGGEFCVSGACPLTTCPLRDGGIGSFQGVCPGASPPAAGYPVCRSPADCTGGSFCADQPAGGCGACVGVEHACTTDSDCLPVGATVCEAYVEASPCLCNGPPNGTRCVPKCPGRACATDTQCSATGHCLPTPCSQGYTCPPDRACKPADASADAHGCGLKLCTEGFPCAADQTCNQSAPQADVHGCAPAPCSGGYACPMGWQCAAGTGSDVHGCTPIPCSMGAPCGVNESCDPTQPGRGCVVRSCIRDSDCDCGACVSGSCEPSIWICTTAPS